MDNHRKRAIRVAQAILDGSMDVVEGSRALAALRHDVGMPNDEDFLVFAAIDSEADRWPETAIRSLFGAEYLEQSDREKRLYLSEVASEVQAACKGLLAKMAT